MTVLLLLNGPPGIGKTTLARRYVDEHPLALCLDIDTIRGLLGQWPTDPEASGLAARAMALAMAWAHLSAGHDVVVPQYVARIEFIEALEAVADEAGASFVEVVLTDTKENVLARHAARGGDATADGVATMYDRLDSLLPSRPHAIVVRTSSGDVNAAYTAVVAAATTNTP